MLLFSSALMCAGWAARLCSAAQHSAAATERRQAAPLGASTPQAKKKARQERFNAAGGDKPAGDKPAGAAPGAGLSEEEKKKRDERAKRWVGVLGVLLSLMQRALVAAVATLLLVGWLLPQGCCGALHRCINQPSCSLIRLPRFTTAAGLASRQSRQLQAGKNGAGREQQQKASNTTSYDTRRLGACGSQRRRHDGVRTRDLSSCRLVCISWALLNHHPLPH